MSGLNGTNLVAKIVPFDNADIYPTHDSIYGLGGWREVDSVAARDAIPVERLREGMVVHVIGDQPYQYLSSAWEPLGSVINASGGTGATGSPGTVGATGPTGASLPSILYVNDTAVPGTSTTLLPAYPFVNFITPPTSGWSWRNQGPSTVNNSNGVLSMQATGTGTDNFRFYFQSLPVAPWTMIAAFIPSHGQWSGGEGSYSEGISLSDGTKYRTFWISYVSSANQTSASSPSLNAQGYDNGTTYNGSEDLILRNLPNQPLAWLKIQDDGTTRSYSLSVDPTNAGWTVLGTEPHSNFLIPSQVGIVMDLYGNSLNGITIQGMPFVSFEVTSS